MISIYDTIRKYYPIGIKKQHRHLYQNFEGIKALEKLLIENIHNQENFQKKWTTICHEIEVITSKKIEGTTMGQAPSFSGSVVLDETSFLHGKYIRELCFSVSLLGPFYQVYGNNYTLLFEEIKGQKKLSKLSHFYIISPAGESAELFRFLTKFIESKFPSYNFVPFNVGKQKINGLETHYLDSENCTIYEALFNDYMDSNNSNVNVLGDFSYGMSGYL